MRRLLAALFLCLAALASHADTAEVIGKGELAIYSSPSGRRRLGQVQPGAEVQLVEDRGAAVKVRYRGVEGWVKRSRLRVAEPVGAAPRAEVPAPAPTPVAPVAVAPLPTSPVEVSQPAPPGALPPAAAPPAPALPTAEGYLAQYDREATAPKSDAGPGLFSVVSALLLVLALVAGAVYLLKLFTRRRPLGGAKAKGIQILASRPLGPRQALLLVDVGGLPMLLAQSEGMVNLIAEIRDPDAVRRLNELYGFRDTPFEAELRSRMDLESAEPAVPRKAPPRGEPADPTEGRRTVPSGPVPEETPPSAEERLAALRRRTPGGEL